MAKYGVRGGRKMIKDEVWRVKRKENEEIGE
jgi:hypothetical protein